MSMNLSQNMMLILAAVYNEDLTALDIVAKIEKEARCKISLGGIYATLERMERAGLIAGEYREAEAEPGKKRPRRFHKILGNGRAALDQVDLVRSAQHSNPVKAFRTFFQRPLAGEELVL